MANEKAFKNEHVLWYIGTRKDSGRHVVVNENYMERYEREFEGIREFDTVEEAREACDARIESDREFEASKGKGKANIRAGKVRGDIKKGSKEDEILRAQIRSEIEAEMAAEKPPSSRGAKAGPRTAKRTAKANSED